MFLSNLRYCYVPLLHSRLSAQYITAPWDSCIIAVFYSCAIWEMINSQCDVEFYFRFINNTGNHWIWNGEIYFASPNIVVLCPLISGSASVFIASLYIFMQWSLLNLQFNKTSHSKCLSKKVEFLTNVQTLKVCWWYSFGRYEHILASCYRTWAKNPCMSQTIGRRQSARP